MSAAAPDTWMPLWIGPYLANTLHLNRAQHGSYCLLIMACWKAGGRLPNNDATLANIARCSAREWKAERAVFAAFFVEEGDWWVHERVMSELEKAQAFKDKQAANGAKGGRPKNPRQTQTKPNGYPKQNPNETTTPSPSYLTTTLPVTTSGQASRARSIAEEWEPSGELVTQLQKARPDIQGDYFAKRMGDFRRWCATKAVMTHDEGQTWLQFMLGSYEAPKQERAKQVAAGLPPQDPWEKRVSDFHKDGFWLTSQWGPKPGEYGCRVPAHLLRSAA